MKNLKLPLLVWLFFAVIAVTLTYFTGSLFALFNFLYIGTFAAAGLYAFNAGYKYARNAVQFGVGLYMLVFLGIINRENMQLSGFFYYLFLGVFEAATVHYAIAKIAGPLLFGRGWCGYACWTAMILDLLPFKTPATHERRPRLGRLRYAVFAATLAFAAALLLFVTDREPVIFAAFIAGNVVYYAVGIAMAFYFKDNRAFCKYFCPITVFLKPFSYFSLARVRRDEKKCVNCGKCVKICPMDVDMMDNSRRRKNGTECILCGACGKACPTKALRI